MVVTTPIMYMKCTGRLGRMIKVLIGRAKLKRSTQPSYKNKKRFSVGLIRGEERS